MKKLSIRERALLILLAVIAIISGYVLFFQMPMTEKKESLQAEIEQKELLNAQLDARLTKQTQMKKTLVELANQKNAPHIMPEYDNVQALMLELNTILKSSQEYSLTFQSEQGEDNIFRRSVTIPFSCSDYVQAREILQKLHNSPLRNQLTDLQISQKDNDAVQVTATMTFFEYSKSADKSESDTAQQGAEE